MIQSIRNFYITLDKHLNFIKNKNYLLLLSLFNCALLVNYNGEIWFDKWFLLVVFFSIWSAIDYKKSGLLILNISIHFYLLLPDFPRNANHCNMLFFIELIFLAIIITKWFKPSLVIKPSLISAVFKVTLISIYFFSGFHKLNTDFFNSNTSCVNSIHHQFIKNWSGFDYRLSPKTTLIFQCLTIFIEMVLPFSLLFKKTQKLGAVLLLFFHFYLSMVLYADFSAFAVFLIFGSILNFEINNYNKKNHVALQFYLLFSIVSILIKNYLLNIGYSRHESSFAFGIVHSLGLIVFVIPFLKFHSSSSFNFKKYRLVQLMIVLAVSFWALKAYIGLGNSGNLTMFSNLVTEKNRSNHLLIDTKNTKLFDFEEKTIFILELDEKIKHKNIEGYLLPTTEFKFLVKKWVQDSKYPIRAKVITENDTLKISDLKSSKFSNSKWWYRFIPFRKIQPQNPNECYW